MEMDRKLEIGIIGGGGAGNAAGRKRRPAPRRTSVAAGTRRGAVFQFAVIQARIRNSRASPNIPEHLRASPSISEHLRASPSIPEHPVPSTSFQEELSYLIGSDPRMVLPSLGEFIQFIDQHPKNPQESPRIPKNPQESPRIPKNLPSANLPLFNQLGIDWLRRASPASRAPLEHLWSILEIICLASTCG